MDGLACAQLVPQFYALFLSMQLGVPPGIGFMRRYAYASLGTPVLDRRMIGQSVSVRSGRSVGASVRSGRSVGAADVPVLVLQIFDHRLEIRSLVDVDRHHDLHRTFELRTNDNQLASQSPPTITTSYQE